MELINFSDAEGIFAGKTLVKLSKDFQQNYPVAKNKIQGVLDDSNEEYDLEGWDSSQWLSVYKNFMKAFGLASPDGALLFQ